MYPAYPRHFFSLRGLVHICIPHTGTPCGRVMGLKVLPTLVGLSLWDCLALAFCTLIVSQLGEFVKRFLKFLSKDFFYSVRPSPLASCGLLLTSLTLYHILSGLSRGLLKKIATFFQRAVSYTVWAWLRHTDFSVLYPNGAGSTRPVPYPLDTNSIPHLFPDCNRQNAQNRDFYFLDICATFLLTNCWRHVIMEIPRPSTVGARPNSSLCTIKKPTAFVSRSQKRWGNSVQMLAISGATPIAFS